MSFGTGYNQNSWGKRTWKEGPGKVNRWAICHYLKCHSNTLNNRLRPCNREVRRRTRRKGEGSEVELVLTSKILLMIMWGAFFHISLYRFVGETRYLLWELHRQRD